MTKTAQRQSTVFLRGGLNGGREVPFGEHQAQFIEPLPGSDSTFDAEHYLVRVDEDGTVYGLFWGTFYGNRERLKRD
jgi:hypothetical protein